jgi:flavin reductase (DIM6/NTAB) family NADH-FMN oxidoreductase RutF
MPFFEDFAFDELTEVGSIEAGAFRQGMRLLSAGVTIVTTAIGAQRIGLTATAVCSLTAEPAMLLACVNREAGAHDPTLQSRVFCVNVLALGQLELARLFADRSRVAERFDEGRWGTLKTGAPVLLDSLASFDCLLGQTLKAETHTVLIGLVQAVRTSPSLEPLLYASGRFGSFADLPA